MSHSWYQRKTRLSSILKSHGDEDADAVALDRLLHGQNVIGKTCEADRFKYDHSPNGYLAKTVEVDKLRFQDKDLCVVGTLEFGQYGVIDLVTCSLNQRVYVRKSMQKRFALRTRDQCFPQVERDILLQALKTNSPWVPHLLAAYQTPTCLNLVMDYAEGGTLWDVLESSPYNGKLPESDLRWWVPQIVSAIHWCHSQGYAHRDIKPHNFVLTPDAHVLLIDFGSAAPLLPPEPDGSRLLPKRYCLVPCGTCDYISPEILQAHEKALVAMEMESDDDGCPGLSPRRSDKAGYGVETDWWSLGAMLYEMAYGVAPFFAADVRLTYQKIMNHEKSLRFDKETQISAEYQHFLRRLLTDPKRRLGRRSVMEITDHPLFENVQWSTLRDLAPSNLHLPKFTYTEPTADVNQRAGYEDSESHSRGFAFSALFQSSRTQSSPSASVSQPTPDQMVSDDPMTSFIGFSWGPALDAFHAHSSDCGNLQYGPQSTPRHYITSMAARLATPLAPNALSPPVSNHAAFTTPDRPYAITPYQTGTIRRNSTIRRTAPRRTVSDREAMKQLVDCVGMSARKKVLESGRKPRILTSSFSRGSMSLKMGKELRFDISSGPIPVPDYAGADCTGSLLVPPVMEKNTAMYPLSDGELSESEGPPSPSPSPRPSSAMSRRSGSPTFTRTLSARSGTPSITGTFSRGRSNSIGFLGIPSSAQVKSYSVTLQGCDDSGVAGNDEERKWDRPASLIPNSLLEEMLKRHESLVRTIAEIEKRLDDLSAMINR